MAARFALAAAALSAVAVAAPIEERQSCSNTWAQCGGIGYTGATCCVSGSACSVLNDYFSQCIPGAQAPSTTTTPVQITTSTSKTAGPTSVTSKSTTVTSKSATITTKPTSTLTRPPVGSGTATYDGNPFVGVNQWANSYYASEILNLAVPSLTGAMATKAAAVAKVPTFQWLDTADKVDTLMAGTLSDIRAANKGAATPNAALFVVYDLPDRDCAAAASNGEYSIANGGAAKYRAYIDSIRAQLITFSDIRTILVVEPDSLANLITNLNVAKCAGAQSTYLELTNYAVKQLNLPNVAMYLDAGHAGWLGYPDNLAKAGPFFASIYKNASSPASLRGLATNVANYNAWDISSPPPYTSDSKIYDEKLYVEALAPLLKSNGWDAHFITDQGRSGKQPTGQSAWGDWCNSKGTGFGLRPSTDTGSSVEDAIVWIKPGGEGDGTSDQSAARYDYHCGAASALTPAPEAGTWFQAYFVQLLSNANPAF